MTYRRAISFLAVLFALSGVACGTAPDPENETEVNVQEAPLTAVTDTCKPPIATTIGIRCPQAGCCLLKKNTSPPSYSCYDCR